ncbi:c-type cytochrome [Cupriavidus taiwanensis]|uniref:Membrane bound protein, weak cytochrome c domains n=2 Tax=Cupriavidus taiwanensis TaxID=164546 RepID=B3R7J2_CUPTR|nr:c-type cytochrome [Cupriavidus taiwanensis]CAQ70989.1 putative membrane bound protein, weak cytochrome c domains [Cupriavidus taiwanensis LMG 19424]SOY52980.1 putative membrane bound protein, weak cytochrome c domains [Cupriavidus taiwanensis]SOY90182.1 putative membrane bound protein, weak cytochrome c domains [Cupriavidus taiwanensis]SOZ00581.1 putative membrane bound protein, weak cytochrome c domains [Cupriavidus taiwanensis]SOZ03669.1 putative membrane bound protein, weak cytochrome c 
MSDVHNEHPEHESPIKTPKQLIAVVIAAFLVPIIVIILLVNFVGHGSTESAGASTAAEAVNDRIKPVASLEIKDPNAPRVFKTGEQVYKEICAACHATGAAGAPKHGAAGDWAARIGQGFDGLMKSVLGGKGAMPPRAGSTPDDYTDYELARAVVYLADAGGAKFPEPPAPAAAAPATAAAPDAAAPAAAAAPAPAAPAAPAAAAAPAPAAAAAAPAAASAEVGKKVYEQVCAACHAAGVAGAPKFGDKAAWAPRLKEGMDAVHNFALKGKGVMPPKGGYAGPDADVIAASDYMANAAK